MSQIRYSQLPKSLRLSLIFRSVALLLLAAMYMAHTIGHP